jgi:hypothetical protein
MQSFGQHQQGVFEVALRGDRVGDGNHGRIIRARQSIRHNARLRPTCHDALPPAPPLPAARADHAVLVRQHGPRARHTRPGALRSRWLSGAGPSPCSLVLPLALPHLRAQWPLLRSGWQAAVVILGLLGVGGYNTLAYIGLQYTPATNAVLLNSFIPIATITLSWLFLKKHLHRVEWLGVVALVRSASRPSSARRHRYTGHAEPQHRRPVDAGSSIHLGPVHHRPAVATRRRQPDAAARRLHAVGLAALAPAYAWEIAQGKTIHVSAGSLAGIAYTGIFPGFLGYVFYNRAVG